MADFAGDWASNPQYQQRIQQLLPKIRQVQQRYGLPDSAIPYILANAGIESRWNVNSRAGSANDVGLLQITPILAKDYNGLPRNRRMVEWGFSICTTEPVYEVHVDMSMNNLVQEGGIQ